MDVWGVGCVVYEWVREWLKGRGVLVENKRRRWVGSHNHVVYYVYSHVTSFVLTQLTSSLPRLFNGRNKIEVRKQQAKFCKRLRRGKGVDWGIQRGKKLRRRERRFLDEIEEMLGGMMMEEGGERWTMEKCANLKLFRRYRRMRRKR